MSTIQVNAIQSSTGTQEVTQTTIFSGTAKAWSSFDGVLAVELDGFSMSSYTDNGTGYYTHTRSISMTNADHSVVTSQGHYGSSTSTTPFPTQGPQTSDTTTSDCKTGHGSNTTSLADHGYVGVHINGDLA